jgi:hypothetical protein
MSTQRRLTQPAETIAALQAFRKRHSEAKRLHAHNASLPTTVDFAHYRSVLKNKAIVDDAEKLFNEFKPVTYDVGAHIKAIEAFETKAVCLTLVYAPTSKKTHVYIKRRLPRLKKQSNTSRRSSRISKPPSPTSKKLDRLRT